MCRVRVSGGLRDWKVAIRCRGHGGGCQGRGGAHLQTGRVSVPAAVRYGAFRGAARDAGTAGHALAAAVSVRGRARESSEDTGAACGDSDCNRVSDATVCRRGGSPTPPVRRKAGQAGSWTGPCRRVFGHAGSGWRARSRHRRIPPVASLCLADRGVGFAVRRVGPTRGRHPLAFATSGGSSLRRLVRSWGRVCSEPCFGRRQRQGRSAPIRRRQRRRQGVCRSSEKGSARFCGLEPIGSGRRRVYRSRYVCGLVVPPTPEHSPDAFLISRSFSVHN
jgi:hypothetical protein